MWAKASSPHGCQNKLRQRLDPLTQVKIEPAALCDIAVDMSTTVRAARHEGVAAMERAARVRS